MKKKLKSDGEILFSSLSSKQQKSFIGKSLKIKMVFSDNSMSIPFNATFLSPLVKAEFTCSKHGFCEVTYSDHPELNIKSFSLKNVFIKVDNKLKVITKYVYNTKKCQGTIEFIL
jgi:hypothetical protein